ncbi:MAG: hypothetical protein HC828_12600 [Blastochloris sp.]|nr:hypothetical protein [Blastochloris sp.]
MYAAVRVAREYVLEIGDDQDSWEPDLETLEFLNDAWFRGFFQLTEEWYRSKYGVALSPNSRTEEESLVLIHGVPFAVKVPMSIVTPDEPGKTAFLRMPDEVLATEDPLAWIANPPNLSAMNPKVRRQVLKDLEQVCGLLRGIRSSKMGIRKSDRVMRGFIQAAGGHLSTAPRLVLEHWQDGGSAKAAWELQMACECSLKAVSQSEKSSFREHHDLFVLYDEVAAHLPTFKRSRLKQLPRWREMASLRYGQGHPPRLDEIFKWYVTTLQLVDCAFKFLSEIGLGKVTFKIGLPPWKQPFPTQDTNAEDETD